MQYDLEHRGVASESTQSETNEHPVEHPVVHPAVQHDADSNRDFISPATSFIHSFVDDEDLDHALHEETYVEESTAKVEPGETHVFLSKDNSDARTTERGFLSPYGKIGRTPERLCEERVEDESILDVPAPQTDRRHWVNPMWMISSFITGVILAIAHHVYYAKLNNTLAGSAARQQWPLRFGTTFAFLFKACLANATGIAYVQLVWRRCRQKAIKIGVIDAALSVDRNVFMFLNLEFLTKFPFAVGLMVIFWCIPLSSLITPATLSVESMPDPTLRTVTVNEPTISSFEYDAWEIYNPAGYDGPQELGPTKLQQMLTVLATTGQMPPLVSPGALQNISYVVDLILPLIRCRPSNETVRSIVARSAFDQAILGHQNVQYGLINESAIFYPENLTFTANYNKTNSEYYLKSSYVQISYYAMTSPYELTQNQRGELWIAVADLPEGNYTMPDKMPDSYDINFYTCVLRNASVKTNVSLVDNIQTLHAIAIEEMDIVGYESRSEEDFEEDSGTNALANYVFFVDRIFYLLSGFTAFYLDEPSGGSYNWTTAIEQTVFGRARDFAAMTAVWKPKGLEDPDIVRSENLGAMIEEFSLNASWGLMAMPKYNKQVQTSATQTLWRNKYAYHPKTLLIAYGCSILACFLTVLVGGYAFYTDGDSINTHFSSISRVMQGPDIAALFSSETTNKKVLEKRVSRTRIRLQKNGNTERFCVDADNVQLSSM